MLTSTSQTVSRTEQHSRITLETIRRTEQQGVEALYTGQRIEARTVGLLDSDHRVEMMVGEVSRMVEAMQNSMPAIMGHIWEGGQDQMPILLVDALGRVVHLPLMLCRNKEVRRHHVVRKATELATDFPPGIADYV